MDPIPYKTNTAGVMGGSYSIREAWAYGFEGWALGVSTKGVEGFPFPIKDSGSYGNFFCKAIAK